MAVGAFTLPSLSLDRIGGLAFGQRCPFAEWEAGFEPATPILERWVLFGGWHPDRHPQFATMPW